IAPAGPASSEMGEGFRPVSGRARHLDEAEDAAVRLVVVRAAAGEAGALVDADRPGVERRDGEPELLRPELVAREREPLLDVLLAEPAAGQLRLHPQADDDGVALLL